MRSSRPRPLVLPRVVRLRTPVAAAAVEADVAAVALVVQAAHVLVVPRLPGGQALPPVEVLQVVRAADAVRRSPLPARRVVDAVLAVVLPVGAVDAAVAGPAAHRFRRAASATGLVTRPISRRS